MPYLTRSINAELRHAFAFTLTTAISPKAFSGLTQLTQWLRTLEIACVKVPGIVRGDVQSWRIVLAGCARPEKSGPCRGAYVYSVTRTGYPRSGAGLVVE